MLSHSMKIVAAAVLTLVVAAPTSVKVAEVDKRQLSIQYAPIPTLCPSTPLVRPASSLNSNEAAYISSRKTKANPALAAWLKKQSPSFSTSSQPVVGLTSSGGGLRALLETAGVVQSFDIRDSNVGTSGLYQGLVYHGGLSGGAWFLSSQSGNNWPTVTYLKTTLWEQAFQNTALLPANLLSGDGLTEYAAVTADITAKQAAGYDVTIVDPYGRLLSYQLLQGDDGGVATRLSGLATLSNFTSYNVPYPIITALGVNASQGQCGPTVNATQYELHPYEYGSWDKGVSAFAQSKYMGSNLTNGVATKPGVCTVHYDNLGYVFGTSSDIFPGFCAAIPPTNATTDLGPVLEGIVAKAHTTGEMDLYGVYPNPFYQYPRSKPNGGLAGQNNPIWPFIQPYRSVDVLIVNDNSADTSDNYPNGTEIRQTYINAQNAGLTKMPFIPDVNTFVTQGLNKRATFFGCNSTGTTLIVFLPNVGYSYNSGQSTFKVQYSVAETDAMIANGVNIGTQNGTAGWPLCLACAIKSKSTPLPKGCNACFAKYCYYRSGTTA